MKIPFISQYVERRKEARKTIEDRLSEIGVEVLDTPSENPDLESYGLLSPALTRRGAEINFVRDIEEKGIQYIFDLRYLSLSSGTWIMATGYKNKN